MRTQFTHVIDIGPTDPRGGRDPGAEDVDGIEQEPMDGTSFLYTLDDAKAAERHTQQYFEMFAQPRHVQGRLVGGVAARSASRGTSRRRRWHGSVRTPTGTRTRDVGWELYNLREDFSQAHDIAAQHPDKVEELQELWWRRPSATECSHSWPGCRDVRHPAADADADPATVRR